jgi:predicted transcriptional regulator YdeE
MGNILSDSYDEALGNFQQRTYIKPTEDTPVAKTVTKTYTVTLPNGHVEEVSEGWLKEMRKWLNNEFGDHTVVDLEKHHRKILLSTEAQCLGQSFQSLT